MVNTNKLSSDNLPSNRIENEISGIENEKLSITAIIQILRMSMTHPSFCLISFTDPLLNNPFLNPFYHEFLEYL